MGAKFDGFSIRDYTSKMRSIDVFKCWPFTSTINRQVTREELQSWLPPMTLCPRSNNQHALNHHNQLSAEELSRTDDGYSSEESTKSDDDFASPSLSPSPSPSPPASAPPQTDDDEKLEMICPVCREFNAATLTAVNAHIDGCLAQTVKEERRHMKMMNSKALKSKPPKKRSIAEIFKVEDEESPPTTTPQVESVMKLWPLRENTDDEVSITVRKFHWLSQRLEALRSRRGGGESVKSGEGDSVEDEKLEMVCPVCRDFNAATVTAVNAHIDGCLAQAVRDERRQTKRTGSKPKPKAPKKRSIAEILMVAPPIQASTSKGKAIEVDEEDEDDKSSDYVGEDSGDEDNTVVSTTKNKKSLNKDMKKKNTKKAKKTKKKKSKLETHGDSDTGVYMKNEKKTTMSKKKKKKKKNIFNNELTGKKESAYKHVVQTTVNNSRKLHGTIGNKMVALQDMDPSFNRKKLGLNGLSAGKKQKVSNFDSVGMQAVSPVRSIVKNHIKHVSGKTTNGCNIREVTEESHEKNQVLTSDRHVKFSRKDNIVSPDKRDSFDETMFSMSSDTATSSVKEQSSESDEETANLETKRNYDHFAIDVDEDKRKEVYPLIESKQFSGTLDQVTKQTFLKPCINQEKFMHLEQKPESLTKISVYDNDNSNNNSLLFDDGKTTALRFSSYTDISKPLSAVQEGLGSGINTQVCESGVFSSSGKFNDHSEDPNFHVDALNKSPNTKAFMEPSSSVSVPYNKVNEKPESPLHTYGDNDNSSQAMGDRQLTNMCPTDMIDKSYSFTAWGKGTVGNSYLDPYFFGLPLNSHGELINFSSSGKEGMNQPEASSPSLQGSVSGLPINNTLLRQSSQESVSINERHVVQQTLPKDGLNSFPHYPPRLPVTKLCSGSEDIHLPNSDMCSSYYVQPLNSEFLKQNSCVEQNHCDRVQNHNGIGMVSLKEGSDHVSPCSSQPTVRLMGKDVPIGRSSQEMHQFTSDVWTDEGSRRRNYAEHAALKNPLLGKFSKQQWVSGSPLQISTECVMKSAKTQSTQGLQSTSGFPQQLIDPRSNHVSHNGSLGAGRNVSSYLSPSTQESISYAVFNGVPDRFQEQFIAGTKPVGLISRPQALPTPCNFSQPTCSRNGGLNDRNINPHVTKSAFGFPFLQSAVNEQAKTSWSQRPYRSSPSWLSSSTDEMPTGNFSQQFSSLGNQSFPQNRWGNNFITPSGNHSAEVLFPYNPLTSRDPMKTTPLCPGSIVQPPQVSVTRPSAINSDHRNINNVFDRVKLGDMVVNGHHPCTNTRKRPPTNFDDSRKPIKLSNIQVKENLSGMTRLTGENSSVELHRNKRALDPQVDRARSRCCQNVAQNVNPTSYPAVDSFKLDGTVRSSPVQFGPKRAEHILKSS